METRPVGYGRGIGAAALLLAGALVAGACGSGTSRPAGDRAGSGPARASSTAGCDGDDNTELVADDYANNRRTGAYKAHGAPALARELWRTTADGAVFGLDDLVIAQRGPDVVGLDATTGDQRWRRPGHVEAVSTERTLLVGDGLAEMVDTATGQKRWSQAVPEFARPDFVTATFSGDYVVVLDLEQSAAAILDATTGTLRNRTVIVGEPDLPALADGVMYVTGEVGQTGAVDLDKGISRWLLEDVGAEFIPPVVACRTVYLGATLETVALDQATGVRRWAVETDQDGDLPPAVDGGLAFIPLKDGIQAVDATSGQERWRARGLGNVRAQPAVASATVYAVSTEPGADHSTLFALSAATGERTAALPLSGVARPRLPVVVAADIVVVPLVDGTVVAFGDAGP